MTPHQKLLITTPKLGGGNVTPFSFRFAGWLCTYLPVHGFVTRVFDEVQRAADSGNPDITPV
jgi:hypothetical protein